MLKRNAVVVVTGASSGIGRATAEAFARRGTLLVLAARSAAALGEVVARCEDLGARAIAVPTDVTDEAAVEALASAAEAAFGRIDVWINNAGVTHYGRFEDTPPGAFRRVIETNLFGCVHGARAVLPRFRRQGSGVLINTASGFGIVGQPFASAYTASKFAIRGLSETLRQELADAPAIHVCTLLPGAIDTPIYQHAGNVSGRAVRPVVPIYPVEEAAGAVVALAERPRREMTVGRATALLDLQKRLAPGVTEAVFGQAVSRIQFMREPASNDEGNLFRTRMPALRGGWSKRAPLSTSRGLSAAAATVFAISVLACRALRDRRSAR